MTVVNNHYQLTYTSKAISTLNQEDLHQILKKSNLNNQKNDVTGCLIFYNGYFAQILEGNQEDVLFIYSKIIEDTRHNGIELLWKSETTKRFFSQWSMGFFTPETESESDFVTNYLQLSMESDKSSGPSESFWSTVLKILNSKQL